MLEHLKLLASYNEWMNLKIYAATARLSQDELTTNRRAFFGSLLGTLNHLVVGDRLWLHRFSSHPNRHPGLEAIRALPVPMTLDQILFEDLRELEEHQKWLDALIIEWISQLTEEDLGHRLRYTNSRGVTSVKLFASLLLHFFNHQTHHRGQVHAMLTQAGGKPGDTDLFLLPE